ncbi:alpha/beta hydrolase [Oceanibacterium hippocampi]|uniref:Phospholipase YtpA n=1 Tax=Oceanibacterium hippocampi TaxID=745714 RepID=A0A1Y5U059_9PROT|nr:alpha/beta hydrolase [Oceanibacterium hippocampi]SLN72837.1 Phospholipase YtpA [Oceanibacterium hippocampi]
MSESRSFSFAGEDGLDIQTVEWPLDAPRAVVIVAHGMAEHASRYEGFARALNGAGYAVYAPDHRGHGRSVPSRADLGHMADEDGWAKAVRDLRTLTGIVRERLPALPVMLFGHSMGSFMAQRLAIDDGEAYSAIMLSSTNGPPGAVARLGRLVARAEQFRLGRRAPSPLIQSLTFGAFNKPFAPARTDFDWLSRDEAEVDLYVADPLCGFDCSTATWVSLLDALPGLGEPEAIARMPKDLPLYVFAGTEDPVGERGRGVARLLAAYERAGLRRVTSKLYPDARHELLHEINRDAVIADLIAWLDGLGEG